MKFSLFVTGTSGFIGSNLLQRPEFQRFQNVYCLSRRKPKTPATPPLQKNYTFIQASLFDSEAYKPYLASSDTVVHLAAATGKAHPEEYFRTNVEGTKVLVDQCKRLGVRKFLYVSSIAVKFLDKTHYPYAQSKERAEEIIRNSGLSYTILRPTLVLGEESQTWKSLLTLGKRRIMPIFGSGLARIQPIYIEDLTETICDIVREEMFTNETFEMGGPESISFEDLLKRIHRISYGREPWVYHLPSKPLIKLLSLLEGYLYSFLPFTAGQLSSFVNDGIVQNNELFQKQLPGLKDIGSTLEILTDRDRNHDLDSECRVFCRYLIGLKPNDYVLGKYREAHQSNHLYRVSDLNSFERFLTNFASVNPWATRICDIYEYFFQRNSLLRKKLVLLLAILETSVPSHSHFDPVVEGGIATLFLRLAWRGSLSLLALLISVVVLAPYHLFVLLRSKRQRRPSSEAIKPCTR